MNAKWYGIVAQMLEAIPKEAWSDPSLERLFVLIGDAQIEAASEGTDSGDLMEAIVSSVVGADEPGRK